MSVRDEQGRFAQATDMDQIIRGASGHQALDEAVAAAGRAAPESTVEAAEAKADEAQAEADRLNEAAVLARQERTRAQREAAGNADGGEGRERQTGPQELSMDQIIRGETSGYVPGAHL